VASLHEEIAEEENKGRCRLYHLNTYQLKVRVGDVRGGGGLPLAPFPSSE
jgi:hypothetical protein